MSEQDPDPTRPQQPPPGWTQPYPQQPPQPGPPQQYPPQRLQQYSQQPPLSPYGPPSYYRQGPPPVPYGYPPMLVAPKSPALALLASFFIPGLGSMLNGEVGKGIGILIGYFVSLALVLVIIGIFGVIAFWVWGMVDAYQGARKWNLRHGIIS